jgi:hypothetical protein
MNRPLIALVAAACALVAAPAAAADDGKIVGVVVDERTHEPIANALVVVQCTCLAGPIQITTNEHGAYAMNGLPPGEYTLQVLSGEADVSKVVTLGAHAKLRVRFDIDPQSEFKRAVRVERRAVPMSSSSSALYMMEGATTQMQSREPAPSIEQRLQEHSKLALAERDATAAATGQQNEPETPPMALPDVEKEPATSPLSDDFARQVVYSGAMTLAVFDLRKAKERIENLVVAEGGWVQSLHGQAMVLRIPASEFRSIADAIGKLGRVDSVEFEALDVTEDYYDLQTRIEVLRRTQKQLLDLLDKARTVTQALDVRRELDEVTLELEGLLGRQRVLASQVRFSALALVLAERIRQTDAPSTNDPFPWVDEIGVEGTAWR